MNLKAFPQINSGNYELDRVQSNIAVFLQQLTSIPLLTGQLLEEIDLSTGNNAISHKFSANIAGGF